MKKMICFAAVLAFALMSAACSLLPNHRLDYQKVSRGQPLTMPSGISMDNDKQAYDLAAKGALLPPKKRGDNGIPLPPRLSSISATQKHLTQQDAGPAPDVSRVKSIMSDDGSGYPMIMIKTRFPWAWEYVGEALEKSHIKIADKDRASGLYFIRLKKTRQHKKRKARVKLSHTSNGVQVVAMNQKGTALLDKSIGHILLARIYAEL